MTTKPGVKRSVIGLMSGTSSDGVSTYLVEITGNYLKTQVELRAYETYPYDKRLRETLLGLTNTSQSPIEEVARLNIFLGKLFADAATDVARKAGVQLREIDLIGSHGHTIIHRPQQDPKSLRRKNHNETCGSDFSFTLQIGEPSVIAHETGITTVADFRMRDVAAGGGGGTPCPHITHIFFLFSVFFRS